MDILRFPLMRVTAWFIPGIAAAYYFKSDIFILEIIAGCFLLLSLCLFILAKQSFRGAGFGIVLSLLSFFAGMTTKILHDFNIEPNHYIHNYADGKRHVTTIVLREKLRKTAAGQRYIGCIRQIDGKYASGQIMVNSHDSTAFPIGSRLLYFGQIVRNKKPLNPGQFDYANYLDNKGVPAQAYLTSVNFKTLGTEKNIWYYADAIRRRVIVNLRKTGFRESELQVVNALILGQQQEISPDIVRDYQYAGAVHILSVSGLHIGFMVLFANLLLSRIPKNRLGRCVRFAFTLILLWSYTIIAGLSPSVVRSAVMFSFVACGMLLRRSTNIYHTLTVSAFAILLFEPEFLFDVGFQLSYAALFFILWIQPPLSKLWRPKFRIVNYFWEILTVSIAAQLGALPLSLYYFHQFPGLFFLTNLVIIPFLTLIMALGLLVIVMAATGYIPTILSQGLEISIRLLDVIIAKIADQESFVLTGVPFNGWMLITSFAIVVTMVAWMKKPNFSKAIAALIAIALFQAAVFGTVWKTNRNHELIVFNSRGQTLVSEKIGRKIDYYQTSGKGKNPIQDYSIANFGKVEMKKPLRNVLWFANRKILVIDSTGTYPKNETADIILLSQSPRINLDRIISQLNPKAIVADASDFKNIAEHWKLTCAKRKIPFHYTNEKGFFRLEP